MKKYCFSTILLILILGTLFISCSKYPVSPPTLKVLSQKDGLSFESDTNGGTWFDSEGGNSFDLGTYNLMRLSEIDSRFVSCNTKIDLNLSFTKDLSEFKVYSIEGDSILDEKLIEVESLNNTITTPSEPGEYGYIADTKWDDTHSVRFIFKFNCK